MLREKKTKPWFIRVEYGGRFLVQNHVVAPTKDPAQAEVMTSMDNKDDRYTTEHIELDQRGGSDHKHDPYQVNLSKDDVQGDYGQTITGDESLGLWATALKYKMATAICFAMTVAAAADGYQIGIVGNIIANEGFVRQFGTQRNAEGEPILAAAVLSGWNSIQSVGQIIGMTTTPLWALQNFGRALPFTKKDVPGLKLRGTVRTETHLVLLFGAAGDQYPDRKRRQ
jgi:hypothetical protein